MWDFMEFLDQIFQSKKKKRERQKLIRYLRTAEVLSYLFPHSL